MNNTQLITANRNQIAIAGINEPVILRYFESLNQEDFATAVNLFTPQGQMQPPFESPVVGREAIRNYLEAEARDMELRPREGYSHPLADGLTEVQVSGKVSTSLFKVHVAWLFLLTPLQEILYVRIKLQASPQELLKLKR